MKIIKLDSVNSTNTYCKNLLADPSGLPENNRPGENHVDLPVAVIADEQYAGRGRYGKSFYSPAGSGIYLSYACEGRFEQDALLKITMVAAAVVHRVLQEYCKDRLSIKWVNDIYRGTRKVSGILCERVDDPVSGRYYVIVGVGVNLFPCELPAELTEIVGWLFDEKEETAADKAESKAVDELQNRLIGESQSDKSNEIEPETAETSGRAELKVKVIDELIEALDAVLSESQTSGFAELVEYYRSECTSIPSDGLEILN